MNELVMAKVPFAKFVFVIIPGIWNFAIQDGIFAKIKGVI
jgi:hypothetical protein